MNDEKWRPHTKSRDMVPSIRELPREWKSGESLQGEKNGTLRFWTEQWKRIRKAVGA